MGASGQPYRAVRDVNLAGGINDFDNELQYGSGELIDRALETPSCTNIDFDGDSVASARGSIKFNNQIAPRSAIRTKVDPALSPLFIAPSQAVPLRGYGYLPYSPETDLGGRSDSEGSLTANPQTQTYHNRRGRSFELNVSFQIPPEEKLYEAGVRGAGAPAVGAESAGFANVPFDEALDECFLIIQKGGDRTAPMSWALGVVNIGNGTGLSSVPALRPSNYALVLMWLDSPQWGQPSQSLMRYNLTSGALPTAGSFATSAFRAVIIHKYVEPGRTYSLAVQVKLDTGTPGGVATNTAWNNDGYVKVWVCEDQGTTSLIGSFVDSGGGGTASGMEVLKGPSDSMRYLSKYGFRYYGADAMFLGLGYRNAPFKTVGFLPNGFDSAPLKNGGFQMVDASASTVATLYGVGVYSLKTLHTGANAYVEVNHQALVSGNANGQYSHFGTGWLGFGDPTVASSNSEALQGYYLTFTADAPAGFRGARLRIGTYTEAGASYRLAVNGAALVAWTFADNVYTLIQLFRWHQRDLIIGEVRIWGTPRDYAAEDENGQRRKFSLRGGIELDDQTEPDISTLVAYWPCDDSEGPLSERVVGGYRTGHLAPFGLTSSPGGIEGERLVFLSGEGEAPALDLSANPVFQREVRNMLAGISQGFAFEVSGVFTEAFWPITTNSVTLPDRDSTGAAVTGTTAQFVPTIFSWDVKDAPTSGGKVQPRPVLALTFGGAISNNNTFSTKVPAFLSPEVAVRSDSQDVDPVVPTDLNPWHQTVAGGAFNLRFDPSTPWVGRYVTIQVGVQSTGVQNEYDVYMAMSPKDAFLPASGDPSDAEFTYWTVGGATYFPNANYYTAAHIRIDPKDFVRSVITLGRWNCGTTKGYCDLQPRMLVDKVRFYGASASGSLPATNGGILTSRNGKLEGTDAMPQSLLTREELLQPIGPGLSAVNLVENSITVRPTSGAKFFTAEARTSLAALKGTYLYVPGDEELLLEKDTDGTVQEQFYRVATVPTSSSPGSFAALETAYEGATRSAGSAYSLRMLGYTAFEDDIRDKQLTLGAGTAFEPGVSTVSDVILSDELWLNVAPITGDWRVRIYSPLGRTSLQAIFPMWVRGLVPPRRNPILGLTGHNGRKYAAVRGALFELDDRWRQDGPDEKHPFSLAFRSRPFIANIVFPAEQDRGVISSSTAASYVPDNSYVYQYDCWVLLDELGQYQTVEWIGNPNTDPSLNASATGHQIHQLTRFNHGRPEFAFGSTAFYTGTTAPEKGLFVVRSGTAIEPGVWTHIRWTVSTRTNAAAQQLVVKPWLQINGKLVATYVNATDNGITAPLTNDWLRTSTIVPGTSLTLAIGAAHDSYRAPDPNISFSAAALGTNFKPQRIQGWMHSLSGRLARVAIARAPLFSGTFPTDFDPHTVTYIGTSIQLQLDLFSQSANTTPGVGHKVQDEVSNLPLVIRSHPFISRWHELGLSDLPASFAEFGQQVIATNGGRPARLQPGLGGLAGVLPPTTKPGFAVQRFPLWKPNFRNPATIDDKNDPIDGAAVGAADQINHYDNHGNNWLIQSQLNATGKTEILWNKDSAGTRYFGFKAYVRPRTTVGYQVLVAQRDTNDQGGVFVAMVDGKLRIGWYDLLLKKTVYVETTDTVFAPGYWHYVNVRKQWPPQHGAVLAGTGLFTALDGNWVNEYFSNGMVRKVTVTVPVGTFQLGETITGTTGAGIVTRVYGAAANVVEVALTTLAELTGALNGVTSGATATFSSQIRPMGDKALVRRFRRANDGALGTNTCWQLLTKGAGRNCLSFTTTTLGYATGLSATGPVSCPGAVFTGAAGGVVTVAGAQGAAAGVFDDMIHPDMLGMFFEWASGSAKGRTYRITSVAASTFNCVNVSTGTADDFAALGYGAAVAGQIFSGIGLVKSTDFDNSKMPDDSAYPMQAFGAPDAADAITGVAPFDGEFASFGWTNIVDDNGEDARVFENFDTTINPARQTNDPIEVGTDTLLEDITAIGAAAGDLRYDAWVGGGAGVNQGTFYSADSRTYAGAGGGISTQPNAAVTIAKDTNPASSVNAGDCVWKYLQTPSTFTGQRYVRTRFFDLDQNQLSNPGEALTIKPDAEDINNPSGQVRYLITDLPQARQAGNLEIWVYMSLAGGDDATMFRVVRVPSGTREVAVLAPEDQIGTGPPIDFVSGEPPRCELVASDGTRMFYGALEIQPDAYVFSQAGFPVSVIYEFASRFNSGEGEKLTMLRSLDGFVLVAKRRALGAIQINSSGLPILQTISEGIGCVANQSAIGMDSRVIFLSEKGLCVAMRAGVTNLGMPIFVARKLQRFFLKGEFDQRESSRCSAAINRYRDQYVMTVKRSSDPDFRERIAMDFSHQIAGTPVSLSAPGGYRFSRYRGPSITALASVQDESGGLARVIGGTEHGFAVWMDREDTPFTLMGDVGSLWGFTQVDTSLTANSTTSALLTSATLQDTSLEGLRETTFRYVDTDGALKEGDILFNGTSRIWFDRVQALAPAINSPGSIGQTFWSWQTPWQDMGNPETKKSAFYFDLICNFNSVGAVQWELYKDRDDVTIQDSGVLPLAERNVTVKINKAQGRWFKLVLRAQNVVAGQKADIVQVVWRVQDDDQT